MLRLRTMESRVKDGFDATAKQRSHLKSHHHGNRVASYDEQWSIWRVFKGANPMTFRVVGLSPEPFRHLFGNSDDALAAVGAKRYVADKKPGFPDRIEMRDGEPGETFLLLNHVSQSADSPYRATHAIFVREGATEIYDRVNEIPDVMRVRLLSLRAFDNRGMMLDADVVDGQDIESVINRFFENPDTHYIHVHNAKRGCYSGRIERA